MEIGTNSKRKKRFIFLNFFYFNFLVYLIIGPHYIFHCHMPSLYPFFECSACGLRVQQALDNAELGAFPKIVVHNFRTKLSSVFDNKDDLTLSCRGQGARYNVCETRYHERHYNFTGVFQGRCCFCALIGGIARESFLDIACFHCRYKEDIRCEFVKLYYMKARSWKSGKWAALPSVVLDHILRIFLGMNVVDGQLMGLP